MMYIAVLYILFRKIALDFLILRGYAATQRSDEAVESAVKGVVCLRLRLNYELRMDRRGV